MSDTEYSVDANGEIIEVDETPAEGETSTPEPEPEPVPTPEPPPEQDVEKLMKSMEKEATRHANRVSEIMGEDADALTPCPLCLPSIPGFVYSDFIPDDQRENVLTLLTGTATAEYAADPLADTCEVCNGMGYTTTGSKVLEHLRRPCPACIGMGFMDHTRKAQWEGEQALRNPPAPPTPIVAAQYQPPFTTADTDRWGRPRGHWLYGKDPEYLADHERAGDLPHIAAS